MRLEDCGGEGEGVGYYLLKLRFEWESRVSRGAEKTRTPGLQ